MRGVQVLSEPKGGRLGVPCIPSMLGLGVMLVWRRQLEACCMAHT
jgi:hypothetical protein